MIGPFDRKARNKEEFHFAFTKDIVDSGIGLITTTKLPHGDVTFAFWPPNEEAATPYYFRGSVVSCVPFGGPFWQVGVEVNEFLNTEHPKIVERLTPLAAKLDATKDAEECVMTR